jgi:predicted AAA+ superfamily ATPase
LARPYFYLNFDDLRLLSFEVGDFALLDAVIAESGARLLFFDEIQSAPSWELYIRQKLDEHFQVIATGSNASLLSSELGTKLTGRHIAKELFPFSYAEFLAFKNLARDFDSLSAYLESGGFPEYLKTGNREILAQLQTDILYRDVAVRHGIRDVESLKRLFTYILSNAANLVAPSNLTGIVGVKSPQTILDYISYFAAAYLIELVPRFAWSAKAQSLAPKKLYIVDSGLIAVGSTSFTKNQGAILENMVFMKLRRTTNDIFYFSEKDSECDFVVNPHRGTPRCIQVCAQLSPDNEAREIRGLTAALKHFNLDEGYIITASTRDEINHAGTRIHVRPAFEE